MRRLTAFVFMISASMAWASDLTYKDLPSWAREKLQSIQAGVPEPEDVDAWVIFERTEFAYQGEGEIRKRQYRIVKMNSDRASGEGVFARHGLGRDSSIVTKLNGWHLAKDGKVTALDRDFLVKVDADGDSVLSTSQWSVASFGDVGAGSVVIWESRESLKSLVGSFAVDFPLDAYPKARYELEWTTGGWFSGGRNAIPQMRLFHPDPWIKDDVKQRGTLIRLSNLPAVPLERAGLPHPRNALPWIFISFLDPKYETAPLTDWGRMGAWFGRIYESRVAPLRLPPLEERGGRPGLEALDRWIRRELAYRQVYLSPERAWVPVTAAETIRRRFGDCKDLSMVALSGARTQGFLGALALARIVEGRIEPDEPVGPFAFNHAIAGIKLPESFGYPAEVDTPAGRYLLYDPTARATPLGLLPESHRGRQVLLCLPDGAIWVRVPDRATEPAEVAVRWEGTAEEGGRVRGKLLIEERGDMYGFRSLQAEGNPLQLRERVASLLDMPVDADWTLDAGPVAGESGPFELRLMIDLPRGLMAEGDRWHLRLVHFNPVPGYLGRFGEAAALPFEWNARGRLRFQGRTTFPWPIRGEGPTQMDRKGPFGWLRVESKAMGKEQVVTWEVDPHDMAASAGGAQSLLEASWMVRNEWFRTFREAFRVQRAP